MFNTVEWGMTIDEVKNIVGAVLQLGNRINDMSVDTPLLGNIPEFDSMAVVTLLTALEEHYGFIVDDDDVSAETFETLGALAQFVDQKTNE